MKTSLLHSLLFLGLAGGCTATGRVGYSASVSAPELIVISPGVQVIANADDPIFYSERYYWRQTGGVWYRSHHHARGFVRFNAPPRAIVSIQRPSMYVRYRGSARAGSRRAAPAPVVRDHRTPSSRKEQREDARDHRKEQREDRKDARDHRKDDKKRHR